jgi:spore coat polysaccharide biosynthesis protein SpsF
MKSGRAFLIIQARMGSTRLPGKSILPLAGLPLIHRLLERARRCRGIDGVVLAIPEGERDEPLAAIADDCGVACFRGSENDLVDRYYQAARQNRAEIVLRLPGDNPVVEPSEIERILAFHRTHDFAFSTNLSPVFGSNYPDGIGAEVIDFWALEEVWRRPADPRGREHPHLNFLDYDTATPANPGRYKVGAPACPLEFARPDLVLDVNTRQEYQYIAALYDYLYPRNPNFGIHEIIRWHDDVWPRETPAP